MSVAIEMAFEWVSIVSYWRPLISVQVDVGGESEIITGETLFGGFVRVVDLISVFKFQYITSFIGLLCQIGQFGGLFDEDRFIGCVPELPAAFSILSAISPFHPSPAGAACVMKGVAAIITKTTRRVNGGLPGSVVLLYSYV